MTQDLGAEAQATQPTTLETSFHTMRAIDGNKTPLREWRGGQGSRYAACICLLARIRAHKYLIARQAKSQSEEPKGVFGSKPHPQPPFPQNTICQDCDLLCFAKRSFLSSVITTNAYTHNITTLTVHDTAYQ